MIISAQTLGLLARRWPDALEALEALRLSLRLV
jgi:hypothetical protein